MKIIILSICVFIMLRNTFSLSPPTFYFPSQTTRILYFLIFNPLAMEEGNPSKSQPLFLADGNSPMNPGAERRGNGDVCGM